MIHCKSTRLSEENFYVYPFPVCVYYVAIRSRIDYLANLTYVHIIHSDEFTTHSVACTFATNVRALLFRTMKNLMNTFS